ncbi:MAG: hypothetical protein RR047_01325 [Bacilli bacterium]
MSMPVIIPSNTKRCQSITDIIESVALEQTGLSHIINAEGEKIQKALTLSTNNEELIKVNTSVLSMVKAITILETVLQDKLKMFDACLCNDCPIDPCTPPVVEVLLNEAKDGTLTLTEPGVYKFTGVKKPAKLTINSTPTSVITTTKPLPAGITLTNNILSIDATYDWSLAHGLSFKIGTAECYSSLIIAIASVV